MQALQRFRAYGLITNITKACRKDQHPFAHVTFDNDTHDKTNANHRAKTRNAMGLVAT